MDSTLRLCFRRLRVAHQLLLKAKGWPRGTQARETISHVSTSRWRSDFGPAILRSRGRSLKAERHPPRWKQRFDSFRPLHQEPPASTIRGRLFFRTKFSANCRPGFDPRGTLLLRTQMRPRPSDRQLFGTRRQGLVATIHVTGHFPPIACELPVNLSYFSASGRFRPPVGLVGELPVFICFRRAWSIHDLALIT